MQILENVLRRATRNLSVFQNSRRGVPWIYRYNFSKREFIGFIDGHMYFRWGSQTLLPADLAPIMAFFQASFARNITFTTVSSDALPRFGWPASFFVQSLESFSHVAIMLK